MEVLSTKYHYLLITAQICKYKNLHYIYNHPHFDIVYIAIEMFIYYAVVHVLTTEYLTLLMLSNSQRKVYQYQYTNANINI